MTENKQYLSSKLAKARQQLNKAQARVTHLEAQFFEDRLTPTELLTSEDRYHRVFDNLLEGAEIIGFDWRYLYVNDASVSHGRQSKEVLLQSTVFELYPGIENTEMFSTLQKCMEERIPKHFETEFVFPDGTASWFDLSVQPIPEGIFILSLDITERKKSEIALNRYAQRMEILHQIDTGIINANSIPAVIEVALKNIRQLFLCQRATVILFDWVTNEWLIFADDANRPYSLGREICTPIPPGWDDGFGTETTRILDDLRLADPQMPHYQPLIKDGLVSGIQALFVVQGQRIGLLGLNADTPGFFTAEHKEIATQIASQLAIALHQMHLSEEMAHHSQIVEGLGNFLQTTLDAFPANTTVLDPDGKIITVNRPWKHFADDNDGQSATHYLESNYLTVSDRAVGPRSEEAPSAAAGIRAVISGQEDEFQLEYPCNSPTEERWFMLRVTAFEESVPRRVVVAHINITERKQAEKDEHEQRVLAEALRDSLAALTASPDVETVMQQILAYSATIIPSEAGTIVLFKGNQGRVAYSRGYSIEAKAFFKDNLIPLESGLFAKGYGREAFYLAADTKSTLNWKSFAITDWIRSSIGVPIVLHGESIGLLIADSETPNRFRQKDVEHLQTFARYAALALENAQHVDQLEQRVMERTADLTEAKEHVEAILNNSTDGILLVQPNLSIQQTNFSFNRLLGCIPDTYFGQSLITLIHADDANLVSKTIRAVIAERHGKSVEIRILRKDGTDFDAELGIAHIKNDGLVCTMRDITERKAQERQLRFHASLQENVSDAVIVTDMEFRIQSWNKAAERIYGWSAEEIVGKATPTILRTEFSSPGELERSIQQLREQGWWQGEVIQHQKDGSIRYTLGSVTLVKDENGLPFGVVSVNHDITERIRTEQALEASEQRFKLLVSSIRDYAIIMLDVDGNIVSWNPGAELIKGYTAEEGIGRHISLFYTPEDKIRGEWQRVLKIAESEGHFVGEGWRVRKDGSLFWASLVITSLRDSTGQLIGFTKVTGDLTVRKQAEEALRESEERFRQIAENIDQILFIRSGDDQRMLYISPRYEVLWGKSRESLYENPISYTESIHPDDLYVVSQQRVSKSYIEEGFSDYEYRILPPDKPIRWVRVRTFPIKYDDGAILRRAGIIEDITERKQSERALQAKHDEQREFQKYLQILHDISIELSEVDDLDEFCKQVVEFGLNCLNFDRMALFLYDPVRNMATGTYGTDTEGKLRSEHHLQFTPVAWEGMRGLIQTPDRYYLKEDAQLDHDLNAVGTGWNTRVTLWYRNQNLGWIVADNLIHHEPISQARLEIMAQYGMYIAASMARKQAENALREQHEFLQQVINNVPELITVKDQAGRLQLVNKREADIRGSTPAEMLGKTNADFNPNIEEVNFFIQKDRQTLEAGQPVFIPEETFLDRYYQTSKIPLKNHDGEYDRLLIVASDITERKICRGNPAAGVRERKRTGRAQVAFCLDGFA